MKRFDYAKVLALGLVIAPPLGGLACGGTPNDYHDESSAGSVRMPLITVTNGHRYRLSNSMLTISGPTYATLFSSDDPAETELSAALQVGSYWMHLQSWSLERDDGTGTFAPARATLMSSNPAVFNVYAGTTTTISYRFETDGTTVVVGSGDLKVNVAVTEIPPVCTPLGDDCSSGSWCPPSGLTGLPLACVSEGAVPLGAPCVGTSDCARNSSCFNGVAGPICTQLCKISEVGTACRSGGICQRSGADYGVCAPATSR